MTAPDTALDRRLHLSLPDWRTALKRRVKRPKRPSFWFWFTLLYVACAVGAFIGREWTTFGADTLAIGYGWWMVVNGRSQIVWRYYLPVCIPCIAQVWLPQ